MLLRSLLTAGEQQCEAPTKIFYGDAAQAKVELGKTRLGDSLEGHGGCLLGNSENKAGEASRVPPLQ